jgi:hypothetical protein
VSVFIAGVVYYLFVHLTTAEILPDAPPKDFKADPDPRPAIAPAPIPEPSQERDPVIRRRE